MRARRRGAALRPLLFSGFLWTLLVAASPLAGQEASPDGALRPLLERLFTEDRLLRPGELVEGELGPSSFRDPVTHAFMDAWRLRGRPGSVVWLELHSTHFDAYLSVMGPGLETALEDDDGAGGTNARLRVEFVRDGPYVALVSGGEGAYTLSAAWRLSAPDIPDGDPELRGRLHEGRIEWLTVAEGEDANCGAPFATSYLAPSGPAPDPPPPPRPVGDGWEWTRAWMEFISTHTAWACRYAPDRATDGDPATGWAEGVDGPGTGEVLVVPVGSPDRSLEIWAGYGKSPSLHGANARPREVRVYLLRAAELLAGEATVSSAVVYQDIEVLGSHQVELRDHNGYQPLPLPSVDAPSGGYFLVAVEILSAYPGSRWDDLVISEVRAVP